MRSDLQCELKKKLFKKVRYIFVSRIVRLFSERWPIFYSHNSNKQEAI